MKKFKTFLKLRLQAQWRKWGEFLRDDRGQAMTEYSLLLGITVPICAWLWHPDNNFFNGMRRLYRRIVIILMYPGA